VLGLPQRQRKPPGTVVSLKEKETMESDEKERRLNGGGCEEEGEVEGTGLVAI